MDKDRLNRIKRIEAIKAQELSADSDKEKRKQKLAATYKKIVSRNGLALEKLAKE